MIRVTRSGWIAYGLAVAIIIADQLSKYWILHVIRLPEIGSMDLLGPLRLSFVQNPGVSFGFLRGQALARWGLSLFALVVTVILATWARRADRTVTALTLGLFMGGAVGNVIDRIRFGWVADFIDVQALHFPWVFNIADSAITVGAALLLLDTALTSRKAAA
jgi:signal peptidase II